MLDVGVSEIHRYPLRPEGFEEPLFSSRVSKQAVAEHLLRSPWLGRASEIEGSGGESARSFREPIELRETRRGRTEVVRLGGGGRSSWRKKRILRLLDSWREVRGWWDEKGGTDRSVYRVLLAGGAVVELAVERPRGWFLVGVAD